LFRDLLKDWVREIFASFEAGTNNAGGSILTDPLGSWSPELYGFIIGVMQNVVMPVAFVLLALFFVLALYRATLKVDGAGGGSLFSVQVVFKTLIKLALCIAVVELSLDIMTAIFDVSAHLIQGMQGLNAEYRISSVAYTETMQSIDRMTVGQQIGMLINVAIIRIAIWILFGLVNIVIIIRFLEIYIRLALAPIALATLAEEETSSIGKNYFKSFAAVCLHGVLILLMLMFFPLIINAELIKIHGAGYLYVLVMYAVLLVIGVFSTNKLAKSICNAH